MNPLKRLRDALQFIPRKISKEVAEQVQEKTDAAMQRVLANIEDASPVAADLLAGNPVELVIAVEPIKVRFQLNEVDKGQAFAGGKS